MKDLIRQRLDIRELVAEYVALKPAGPTKWKGLSPFSKEKTPSFYVDTAKGLFYCFSTKQGGDAFKFLMLIEGLGFRDALEKLAARTGVELEPERETERQRRDLFEINLLALEFFRAQLQGEALDYLVGRGVSQASMEQFGLGFAPNSFDALLKHAKARGCHERELLEAGLLSEASDTGRIYDRFRNRVMFPIRDYLGRVVAFGGRVLDDSKPKYLNSPETPVFKKGETLYGLDLARKHIQSTGEAVVVEGYMDVIAMHQNGFGSTVASLGTALTFDHAHLLARQGTRRLALLFDNDAAGQRATLQGLDQEIGRMFLVRAVVTSDAEHGGGKDAAEILGAANGVTQMQEALAGGYNEVEFRLNTALEHHDASNLEGKRAVLEELLPALRPRDVFDPVALELRRLVIDRLGLDSKRVDEWINTKQMRNAPKLDRIAMNALSTTGDELKLAKMLVQNPGLTAKLDGEAEFEHPLVAELIQVARFAHTSQDILEHFQGRPEASVLFEGVFSAPENTMTPEHEDLAVMQISSRKREDNLRTQLLALKAQLASVPSEGMVALLRQVSDTQRAIEAERRLRLRN